MRPRPLSFCSLEKNAVDMFGLFDEKPRRTSKLSRLKKMKAKLAKLKQKEAINRETERVKKELQKMRG